MAKGGGGGKAGDVQLLSGALCAYGVMICFLIFGLPALLTGILLLIYDELEVFAIILIIISVLLLGGGLAVAGIICCCGERCGLKDNRNNQPVTPVVHTTGVAIAEPYPGAYYPNQQITMQTTTAYPAAGGYPQYGASYTTQAPYPAQAAAPYPEGGQMQYPQAAQPMPPPQYPGVEPPPQGGNSAPPPEYQQKAPYPTQQYACPTTQANNPAYDPKG